MTSSWVLGFYLGFYLELNTINQGCALSLILYLSAIILRFNMLILYSSFQDRSTK